MSTWLQIDNIFFAKMQPFRLKLRYTGVIQGEEGGIIGGLIGFNSINIYTGPFYSLLLSFFPQ